MGFGGLGEIILVLALLGGVWFFMLSPDAELNRTATGGLFHAATGDKEAAQKDLERIVPKLGAALQGIAKSCPVCKTKGGINNPTCKSCIERHKGALQDEVRNTPLGKA